MTMHSDDSRVSQALCVLSAIVRHTVDTGGMLRKESPLISAAEQILGPEIQSLALALVSPAAASAPACLPVPIRRGLSDEEQRLRRNTLGSSEIAAICGVNPYASMHNVWLAKVMGESFDGNEATELGNILEPAIFGIYAERYGRQLTKGVYTVGPEPWIACTPDAHIVGGGLVEAKLVGFRTIYQWGPGNTEESESDAVPLHYMCQAQWQMLCTGEAFCDLAALMGTEFRSYTVRADHGIQERLLAVGREFWEKYVLTRTPPPVDGSEGASQMLRRLYPRSGGNHVPATPTLEAMAESLRVAREAYALAEAEKKNCENQMKAELKDAPGAFGETWRLRYSTTKIGSRPFVFDHQQEKDGKAA